MLEIERGDVVVCVLSGDYGKPRPAVVIQSDLFNATHASITICPIASHLVDAPLFRLPLAKNKKNGLKKTSQIMVDKVMTLSRDKISQKIGFISLEEQDELDEALKTWIHLRD